MIKRSFFQSSYWQFSLLITGFLLIIRWVSDFNGLYGQDSHEYFRYAMRWREYLLTGQHPGDYFWPINYAMYGAFLSLLLPFRSFPLQLISILSLACLALYTAKLIRFFHPESRLKNVYTYLSLALLLSPFIFQYALSVMSDIPAAFLICGAIYHVLKYWDKNGSKDFFFAVFFITSAFMTRYLSALVLFVPSILLAAAFLKRFKPYNLVTAIIIIVLCLFPHFWIRGSNAGEFIAHNWLQNWHIKHWLMRSFFTIEGSAVYLMPNFIYGFSNFFYPGFIFFGIFIVFFIRKTDWPKGERWIVAVPILLYALFLAGIPIQNMRYLTLTFPLVVVLFYPLFHRLQLRFFKTKLRNGLLIWMIVLGQSLLIYKYSANIYRVNQVEKEIAFLLKPYSETTLYTFWIDGALRSYGIDNTIVNLWDNPLNNAEVGSLVLFNLPRFKKQWADKNPMNNWLFLNENYQLEQLENLSGGWKLYRIEKKP